jgi:hypothetical protein
MLKNILAISGKPGLYKLVSQGNKMLIVETLDVQKRRMPAYSTDRIITLNEIAMFTDEEEVPLAKVLEAVKAKENGEEITFNLKTVSKENLHDFMSDVLPNYDRDRVHDNDIKKLCNWYNILIKNGITNFEEIKEDKEVETHEAQKLED